MDVTLSLQEEWSPELLSELQRAVPVLESGSRAEEANQCVWSPDWPRNFKDDSGLRWSSWAHDARGLEVLVKPDLLSDTAMALPMSTMTSGKRKTYANRSTFQAHVCCVMDPEQVPKIMESLQKSSHLSSARSWPHAYRILSPFDGQVHVFSEDDEDPGAGEKILGLLERMGLENLLLVVSHWNAGGVNRLGNELFKCVTEQCKDLLKELQEALRAAFPPEDLLLRSDAPAEAEALEDGQTPRGSGTESLFGSDSAYGFDVDAYAAYTEQRHVDVRAIGATPPPELMYASRGVCIHPNRRTWPKSTASSSRPEGGNGAFPAAGNGNAGVPADVPVVGRSCFQAQRPTGGQEHHGSFASVSSPRTSKVNEAPHTFMTDGDIPEGVDFNELSNEDLEKLCQQLENDRDDLERRLDGHQEVIESFKMPTFSKGPARKLREPFRKTRSSESSLQSRKGSKQTMG